MSAVPAAVAPPTGIAGLRARFREGKASLLKPFGESLLRLKRLHNQCGNALRALSDSLPKEVSGDRARIAMTEAQSQLLACQSILQQQLADLELSDRRTVIISCSER